MSVQSGAQIQDGIDIARDGATVDVATGTYTQTSTLNINKELELSGAARDEVIIDARSIGNNYGISVSANNVSLNNFTLYGSASNTSSAYGIKVSPGGAADSRLSNFSINQVVSCGAGRAELDLNGVNGATISDFIADGAPIGDDTGSTNGAGIQLTDTANVTVSRTTTRNNAWGGVALYQANRSYNQQTGNITIAADNDFTESNPLYAQGGSLINDFGTLTLNGYSFAVQNETFRDASGYHDGQEFTFFQKTEQDAVDFALSLATPKDSVTRRNSSATYHDIDGDGNLDADGEFIVGANATQSMSIAAAIDAADRGARINVRAGTYDESLNIGKALTLSGAGAGESIIDPVSGNGINIAGDIGTDDSILIDGFSFQHAAAGINVAADTVLDVLTVSNSDFSANAVHGFRVSGNSSTGVPGLNRIELLDSNFNANGADYTAATSLGHGDISINYCNGDATLRNLAIAGYASGGAHQGIQLRGTNVIQDAGTVVFDNVSISGSYRRPDVPCSGCNSYDNSGTWNPGGPGTALHILGYDSVENIAFDDVVLAPTVGHALFAEGLSTPLDIGNTVFGVPDTTVTGAGAFPTTSWNIFSGTNSQNNVLTHINATAAQFTAAADGFAIEDRVLHALDSSAIGLATWDQGQLYVTQNSGSIQRGVDVAETGDTVNVAAGNFSPFSTDFNGAQNISIIGSEGTGISLSGSEPLQRIVDLRADGTIFKGFSIDGGGTHVGISISGQAVTVSDNVIDDVLTGIQTTTQYVEGNNTITGNSISNSGYGVSLQNNSNVVANNIIDVETEGLGIGSGGNTISDNQLSIGIDGNHLQAYTKEDNDKLPGADIDLIQVVADNEFDKAVYITDGSNVTVQTIFGAIQRAIDEATAKSVVNVLSGTYAESLSVDKALILNGAGSNNTIIAPTSLTADDAGLYNILTIGGGSMTNVEVSGFTIKGPVANINSGILVRDGAQANIHHNQISDIRPAVTLGGGQRGIAILVGFAAIDSSGRAEIRDNVISGYQKGGIVVDGVGSEALVSDNTVTGAGPIDAIAQNGIQISRGASATVEGNTVSAHDYSPASYTSAGILIFTPGVDLDDGEITINANTVTANEIGISTNDPRTLAAIDLTGVNGNTRNARAFFSGGFTGAGTLLEYPAWDAPSTALVNADSIAVWETGDIFDLNGTLYVAGWDGFSAIQPALDVVGVGGLVNVAAGTYHESLNIHKALTLDGSPGAIIAVSDSGSDLNGINIWADGVTVSNLDITGPVDASYLVYDWGTNISRGIAVASDVNDFKIENNSIHDIRNGILIDGRGNSGQVSNNRIENTQSGISVQYTDAFGIDISANSEGTIGNEWGLNLHFNGFLNEGTIHTNPHLIAPTEEWQQALLDLSRRNGGWRVRDLAFASSNRSHVEVATTGAAGNQGSLLTPISSLQSGIDAAVNGGRVNVTAGTYAENVVVNGPRDIHFAGETIANSFTFNTPFTLQDDTTLSTLGGDIAF